MKIIDISMTISPEMQVYKDKKLKKPTFEITANHKDNSHYETKVNMGIHCGTHIDMPLHMIEEGKTMDTFDFKRLITKCKVFDLSHLENPVITKKDIENLDIIQGDFIIFKTINSNSSEFDEFNEEFVYVDESAALHLKNIKINGVGIDALGIERAQSSHMTHKLLLGDDIIILEGLVLSAIKAGEYDLIALPIKLSGTEGSWVRAVLISNSSLCSDIKSE